MQRLRVVYRADGTLRVEEFRCFYASTSITDHSTIIEMVDGVEIETGLKVKRVMYTRTPRIIQYIEDDGGS